MGLAGRSQLAKTTLSSMSIVVQTGIPYASGKEGIFQALLSMLTAGVLASA